MGYLRIAPHTLSKELAGTRGCPRACLEVTKAFKEAGKPWPDERFIIDEVLRLYYPQQSVEYIGKVLFNLFLAGKLQRSMSSKGVVAYQFN